MVVYTFHMPAFIIISGYFSRSFDMRPDRLKRLVTGVAVPYVVFEIGVHPLQALGRTTTRRMPISLLDPWYLTWFLVALFVWRLTTPMWKLVRWPLPLALGHRDARRRSRPDIGDDLDLQRVLQFLPFFVLGLCPEARALPAGAPPRGADRCPCRSFAAALAVRLLGGAADERRVVLPPRHRPGVGRALVDRAGDDARAVRLLAAADRLLLRLGAAAGRCGSRRSARARCTAICCTASSSRAGDFWGWYDHAWLHRPLGEIFVTRRRRRRRDPAVHPAGAAGLPVRDGARDGVGVQAGRCGTGPGAGAGRSSATRANA